MLQNTCCRLQVLNLCSTPLPGNSPDEFVVIGIRTRGKDLRYPDYYISTNIDNCSGFCSLLNRACFL